MPVINEEAMEILIENGKYLDHDLITVQGLREKQDPELVENLIECVNQDLGNSGDNKVEKPSFFIGSVDFMVHESESGEKEFAIIETNGGSSRGLSAIHRDGWRRLYEGLEETVKFVEDDPLVLIGHPDSDGLLQEKIFLAKSFEEDYGLEYLGIDSDDSGVVLGSYGEILPKMELDDSVPLFDGEEVDVIIGDGVIRRREDLEKLGLDNELDVVLANDVFPITDDKALTYEAVELCSEELEEFRIHPLDYDSVPNRENLIEKCKELVEERGEIVIKPYGGSGGNGVNVIEEVSMVKDRVDESLKEFYSKFGEERRAFPYTIVEKVNLRPTVWKGSERNFDIRIYVARIGDRLVPCGGLGRIALEPIHSGNRKKSFVVNLSGYEGIDVDRGIGISEEGFDVLDLTEEDFKDMFSASVVLFRNIVENHGKVLNNLSERIEKTK